MRVSKEVLTKCENWPGRRNQPRPHSNHELPETTDFLHQPTTTATHITWAEEEPPVHQSGTHTCGRARAHKQKSSRTTHFQIPVHHPNLGHEVQRPESAVERCPRIVLREGPLLHNLVQQRTTAYKVHYEHGVVLVIVTAVQRRHAWVQRHETHRLQFILQQSLWTSGRAHARRGPGNSRSRTQRKRKQCNTTKRRHPRHKPDCQDTSESGRHNAS